MAPRMTAGMSNMRASCSWMKASLPLSWRTLFLLALLSCASTHPRPSSSLMVAARPTTSDKDFSPSTDARINEVIDWLNNAPEGFFNDKQVVRKAKDTAFHSGSEVGLGMFAQERIEEGEELMRIPWDHIIAKAGDDEFPSVELECHTVTELIKQVELGEESYFAPYVNYLMNADMTGNPSAWSQQARQMFDSVLKGTTVYQQLAPFEGINWLDIWENECMGQRSPVADRAVIAVVSRANFNLLIPMFDFYNHVSDPELDNVDSRVDEEISFFATRTIEAGEPIAYSYLDPPTMERPRYYGTIELFGQYGFIPDYPQTWAFFYNAQTYARLIADIEENDPSKHGGADEGAGRFTVEWDMEPIDDDGPEMLEIYVSQLARVHEELSSGPDEWAFARNTTDVISEEEWNLVVNFIESELLAAANMLRSINDTDMLKDPNSPMANEADCFDHIGSECFLNQLYHTLQSEKEIVPERQESCDSDVVRNFTNYQEWQKVMSEYQQIVFRRRTEDDGDVNVCMTLDNIVQICDNYRPHYHEYAVNYAARYLPELKRVAFIGGGDSMILQEVLKYPNLELVIGLELDQVVVRNAFEWFHTDPHFHDDRVEWWFGDATKSLLLLPREYMNSFDFVMVDVSETGASLTVTEHLDILNAMALLVKPGGIMVKNEPHFEKISATFDYSVDVHFYDNPMICDQSMIMGSNHIDFYHHDKMTDHGVDNLLLPEIDDYPHQYYLWRDYKINDPTTDGSCDALAEAIEDQKKAEGIRKGKSEGMLMVIEVEHCAIPLNTIESALMTALEGLGFTSIVADGNNKDDDDDDDAGDDDDDDKSSDIVIMMAEGYVIARWWKGRSYVGLDIHLWGRFEKMDATRTALVKALGAGNDAVKGSVSSYRVIVSGMYGNNSWEEDTKLIGPDLTTHTRKCDTSEEDATAAVPSATTTGTTPTPAAAATIESLMADDDFLATSLGAITDAMDVADGSMVVVFCGSQSSRCLSASALEKSNSNSNNSSGLLKIVPVHVCPEMESLIFGDGDVNNSNLADLHECRHSIEDEIKSAIREHNQPIGAVILDAEAPYAMARIFTSFWTFRRNIFQNTVVPLYVSILPDSTKDEWRRNTLKQIRLKLDIDPLTRTEIIVQPKRAKMDAPAFELSILTVDMNDTFPRIRRVEDTIATKYGDTFMVKPSVVQGGTLRYLDNDEFNATLFSQRDYDLSAEKQQLEDQLAFGRQSVLQLGRSSKDHDNSPNIASIMTSVMEDEDVDFTVKSMRVYDDVGDGVVVVARCVEGTVVSVWDGRDHIVVNLFQFDQERSEADLFLTEYLEVAGEGWSKELRDDMPRGTNKVINFSTNDSK